MIWTILFVGYLATWAVIPFVLLADKKPVSTLAWVWSILLFPYLGALAYLIFGIDRMKRKRFRRRTKRFATSRRALASPPEPDRKAAALMEALDAKEQELLRLLARLNEVPTSTASDVQMYFDAGSFYPALERTIKEARKYLHIEFFVWKDDEYGQRFLDLLIEAAKRGVKVRLLADEIGCLGVSRKFFQPLVDAGGEFSWFNSIHFWRNRLNANLRNHRKLQIADGAIAFVGGMNIGAEYDGKDATLGPWRDAQMGVAGDIISPLQDIFANDWYFATGRKIGGNGYEPLKNVPVCVAQAIAGGPDSRDEPMPMSMISLLNFATKRAWIATGYFVPDATLLSALQLCAARGVDVRLIVSEKSDHPFLLQIGRSYYEDLLRFGVRVFEYSKGVNHTKGLALDGEWLMVGSANFDNRSMRLSFELNVLVHSREKTAELENFFREDFQNSREILAAAFGRRPFTRRLLEASLRPLAPLL